MAESRGRASRRLPRPRSRLWRQVELAGDALALVLLMGVLEHGLNVDGRRRRRCLGLVGGWGPLLRFCLPLVTGSDEAELNQSSEYGASVDVFGDQPACRPQARGFVDHE